MCQHVVPIHLIGGLSPADIERLVVRLLDIEARREGEPQPGEPMLQKVTVACAARPSGEQPLVVLNLAAVAELAGGGEMKARFEVEVHFCEGCRRPIDDSGSLEVLKEMAWPPVRDALRTLGRMLTARVEMRPAAPRRPGLLDRLRWWAMHRAAQAG